MGTIISWNQTFVFVVNPDDLWVRHRISYIQNNDKNNVYIYIYTYYCCIRIIVIHLYVHIIYHVTSYAMSSYVCIPPRAFGPKTHVHPTILGPIHIVWSQRS